MTMPTHPASWNNLTAEGGIAFAPGPALRGEDARAALLAEREGPLLARPRPVWVILGADSGPPTGSVLRFDHKV